MDAYLPISQGYLPLYVLIVGVTAITNAISCYNTTAYVKRLYAGQERAPVQEDSKTTTITVEETTPPADRRPSVTSLATAEPIPSPVTPLSSRTFATWNIAVGIVRLFAAYHINEPAWYQMQLITNLIGIVHFGSEAFIFKTARPSGPWFAPVIVASIGVIWSVSQYNYYVR